VRKKKTTKTESMARKRNPHTWCQYDLSLVTKKLLFCIVVLM